MKSWFAVILVITTFSSSISRKISGKIDTSESWIFLERFAFVPEEGFPLYMGDAGVGLAQWEIYHNFNASAQNRGPTNSWANWEYPSTNNINGSASGIWLLGFPMRSYANFVDRIASKGGSDSTYGQSGYSCSERIEYAKIKIKINEQNSVPFDANSLSKDSGPPNPKDLQPYKYKWQGSINITAEILQQTSPKMIYWVVANCGLEKTPKNAQTALNSVSAAYCSVTPSNPYCQGSLQVYYVGHFTQQFVGERINRNSGGTFILGMSSEVGYNFIGIGDAMLIVACIHTGGVMPFAVIVALALWAKKRMHMTVWLLLVAIVLQFFSYLFTLIYQFQMNNGDNGQAYLFYAGRFSHILADMGIIALLLCLAGGWTVTRRKLKMWGRVRLLVFMIAYFMGQFAALVWYSFTLGSGRQYLLESPAGIMALVLLGFAAFRFLRQCELAIRKWPEHHSFWFRLRALGIVYILHLPVLNLISLGFSEMFNTKIVWIGEIVSIVLCMICLLLLYHPRLFPASFPFHAQIEDMKMYKLKQAEDIDASVIMKQTALEKTNVISFTGGAVATAQPVAAGGDDPSDSRKKAINFTGTRAVSFTGGTSVSAAKLDSNGKLIPTSYFDKKQLRTIKTVQEEVDAVIASLNEYSHSLQEILNRVNTESDPSQEAAVMVETTTTGSLREDMRAFSNFRKSLFGGGNSGGGMISQLFQRHKDHEVLHNDVEHGSSASKNSQNASEWRTSAYAENRSTPAAISTAVRDNTPVQILSQRQQKALINDKLWKEHEKVDSSLGNKAPDAAKGTSSDFDDEWGDGIDYSHQHIPSYSPTRAVQSSSDNDILGNTYTKITSSDEIGEEGSLTGSGAQGPKNAGADVTSPPPKPARTVPPIGAPSPYTKRPPPSSNATKSQILEAQKARYWAARMSEKDAAAGQGEAGAAAQEPLHIEGES